MEIESMKEEFQEVKKPTRGGARPGAGRKKKYESKLFTHRLKCRYEIAERVRTCITILDSLSEKRRLDIYPTKLSGEEVIKKGGNLRTWTDTDAFSTPWSITVDGKYDERIFALAFILEHPQYVRIHCMNHNGTVQLNWQRVDEIGRIMMTYGNLMARRNRLRSSEQEVLNEIPDWSSDIVNYIADKLNY